MTSDNVAAIGSLVLSARWVCSYDAVMGEATRGPLVRWQDLADRHEIPWDRMWRLLEAGDVPVYDIDGDRMVDEHQAMRVVMSDEARELEWRRVRAGELAAAKRKSPTPLAVTTMMSSVEREQIDRAAELAGLTRAAWCRQVLLDAARAVTLGEVTSDSP